MLIIRSQTLDPHWNLAAEEYLLDRVQEYGRILFLWQSDHAVVIGKHQNPWRECDLKVLRSEGGKLARRISGGGAVYQDRGNLNFALFLPREDYSESGQFRWLIKALGLLGVEARRMGKNSLSVNGRKISGNAFCFRKQNALHHGTLLISTDLDRLQRYLKPAPLQLKTRAIASVPAEVVNLAALNRSSTVDRAADVFINAFRSNSSPSPAFLRAEELNNEDLAALYKKHKSREWIYGQSPPFELDLKAVLTWGTVDTKFQVEKGTVNRAELSADTSLNFPVEPLVAELTGKSFSSAVLAKAVRSVAVCGFLYLEDLAQWFEAQAF